MVKTMITLSNLAKTLDKMKEFNKSSRFVVEYLKNLWLPTK